MTTQRHPASMIQKQFWATSRRDPTSPAFNVPSVFNISGKLDVQALQRSLSLIVDRHEAFRTTFLPEDGELFQVVASRQAMDMPVVPVPGAGGCDPDGPDSAEAVIREEISRPFDLKSGPLIRWKLLDLPGDRWVLIVVFHHIISDLRTKDLFAAELSDLYRRCLGGQTPGLDEPAGQYVGYTGWHRDFLGSDAGREMCSAWGEWLGDKNGTATFPGDFSRPASRSLSGGAVDIHLPEALTGKLKEVSRKQSTGLFLTLLTTFFVLLHRYSGRPDVTIGVPFTNRRQAAHKDVMGCFMNILPVAVEIGPETTFMELLGQVRTRMLEGHRRQEVPLRAIVEHVRPQRDARYNPFFQVGFTFEHPMTVKLDGVDVESVKYHSGGSQLDLFPVLWEQDGEVRGHIEYCGGLYTEAMASTFVANYRAALEAVAADPTAGVATLPILDGSMKHRIEVDWNDTARDYPSDATLKTLFEGQVTRTPDKPAAVFGDERLTYTELNSRCNRLAHYLMSAGVGPNVPVGIFMDRSLEMLESIYAVVKAGGAYVPLDPGHPSARIASMLDDAQATVILTMESRLGQLPAVEARIICVDSERTPIHSHPDTNPDVTPDPQDIAYIIFTSGSTGRPKGAVNSHRGICNRIQWMQDELGLSGSDMVLQKTPITFDVSVWELFWPLAVGATLVVAAPGSHRDPSALVRQITEHGITTIHFVPSMLQAFLANADTGLCTSIKCVVCSGEPLTPELVGRFFLAMDAELYNLYGPTEAAIDVTSWRCTREDVGSGVPIGRPIANTRIYIVDDRMQSVPIGAAGELHIGGVQVAMGYAGNAELTARSFVPDPFSRTPGSRLYRTGDVARYLTDGNIEFIGRRDSQVQIRGFRVELEEIETVMCEHLGIAQAVAVLSRLGTGDSRVIAYAVPHDVRAFTVRKLLQMGWEAPSKSASSELPNGLIAATMANGLMLCHLNPTETEFLYEEIFVSESYLRHGVSFPEHACVFDVGAHIGMFSVFAALASRGATVHAFEPIPPVFAALECNAAIHDLEIIPTQCGLSDRIGSEEFTYYPNVSILSGSHADPDEDREVVRSFLMREIERQSQVETPQQSAIDELLADRLSTETYQCEVTTISQVMRERDIDQIDLLKIDVEKSELQVLAGIESGDWKKIRQICVEVHEAAQRVDEVVQLLEEHAFAVAVQPDAGTGLRMVYASRAGVAQNDEPAGTRGAAEQPNWQDPTTLTEDLKRSISARLPDHMVPSDFVLLDELPLTPSGKIDRNALPSYEPRRSGTSHEYVAPRPGTETELASLWSALLKIDQVGTDDNFFDIGGNSLLGVYLVGQIEGWILREVSVVKLFEYPTIRTMAAYLDQGGTERSLLDEAGHRAKLRSKARRRRPPDKRA